MNDITKARHYLKTRRSDLEHLGSFALMLSTAENRYREIRMRQSSNIDTPGTWEVQEVEAALDYAALKYLKKYNHLPKDAVKVFSKETTLEDKREIAQRWATQ